MTPPPVEPRATDGSSTETTSDQPVATTSAGGFNGRDGTGNDTDSSCVLPITDRQVDQPRVAAAIREILIAIGEDPDRDGLQDTPARVARAYQEIYGGLSMGAEDALTITFDVHHDELIIVKDIELYSMCEHHLLPFHGVAHVGYVPNKDGRVTGLSKLARLVDVYARRPQVQERLTAQIADALEEVLDPRGVIVVIECEHTCMSMRGVRRPGSTTLTSAVRGQLRNAVTRSEALDLILGGRK